jgi:hypothetical protein
VALRKSETTCKNIIILPKSFPNNTRTSPLSPEEKKSSRSFETIEISVTRKKGIIRVI